MLRPHPLRALFACLVLLLSLPVYANWQQHHWDVMGTRASVSLWSEDDATDLFQQLETEMERLNQLLSPWVDDSELARLNRLGHKAPQTISPEFYQLLERSLYFYQLTDGAFDITFASAGHLYDYRQGKAPDETALAEAVRLKGIKVGVDVFEGEPSTGTGTVDNPLFALPGVIGTHHIGGATLQAHQAIADETVRIALEFASSGVVLNSVE